jgi:hypothetical protein
MLGRSAVVVLAGLLLVGCQSDTPGLDLSSGTWNGQSLNPPSTLVRVNRGDLIGRPINVGQSSAMTVHYVLADPVSLQPMYVAASSESEPGNYVILPYSQLNTIGPQITANTTPRSVSMLPHMTAVQLENYRVAQLPGPTPIAAVPVVAPAATPVISGLPPVTQPMMPMTQPPLALVRRGSVVGMPVVDSLGQPIGQIEALATQPGTGEVRYAVISGPAFGTGNYIAVPSSSTQLVNGRVVVASTLANMTQMPRYRSEELPQTLGALWSN